MSEQTSFKQSLGLVDATMIVAGSMIGSGIFIVSADIVRNTGSAGWMIAVWLIAGFMTIAAAVSYGELGGMFPKVGGQYVYLKEAYSPLMGFLYGWSFFAVIKTASVAAVAIAFTRFSASLFPALSENNILADLGFIKISAAQITSIILIFLLTAINTRGIKEGKLIQNTFTAAKLLALLGLTLLGFFLVKESFWSQNWETGFNTMKDLGVSDKGSVATGWQPISGTVLVGAIAAAMVGSVFSYDGWDNVTFVGGEIKNPKRNIGLSLFLGTLIVTLLYIATNLMYLNVMPLNEIAFPQEDRLAVSAANRIFGAGGMTIIAILVMVSTFGANNGLILAGARVYYAMAQDKLFFKKAGELNKNAVPQTALWAQCVVASLLCLSGRYGDLLDMIAFGVVVFYVLTVFGIFILRKKRPDIERPYKAFGYPVLPLIYILMGTAFCVSLIVYKPTYTIWGLGIMLSGIPLYYIAVSRQKK